MSRRNGDRARFQKERKRRMLRRQRIQEYSAKIRAASEKVDSSAYWRCEACGQMWNVGRLKASHRPQFGGRWNNGY